MKQRLAIVHNLTSENLDFANDLGGLPCPSIAITTNDIAFTDFGHITLLMDAKNFNPKKHPTFDSDVYSVRTPPIVYKLEADQINQFKDKINQALLETGDASKFKNPLKYQDELLDGYEKSYDDLKKSTAILLTYANDIGISPRIPKKKIESPVFFITESSLKFIMKNDLHEARPGSNDRDKLSEIAFKDLEEWISREVNSNTSDSQEDIAKEKAFLLDTFTESYFKSDSPDKPELNFRTKDKIEYFCRKLSYNPNQIDESKLNERLTKLIGSPKKEEQFSNWLEDQIGDAFHSPYFEVSQSGRNHKKVDYTIDNLVKHMKGNIRSSESSFFFGAGDIRSQLSQKFSSKTDIVDQIDRLIDEKSFEAVKSATNKELQEWPEKLAPYYQFKTEGFHYRDAIYEEIGDYAKSGRLDSLKGSFHVDTIPESTINELDTFLERLKTSPTTYFEIKRQDAVAISDFSAAIIPKDTPKEIISILRDNGLKVSGYERNNDQDRLRALNRHQDLMFGEGKEITIPLPHKDKDLSSTYDS